MKFASYIYSTPFITAVERGNIEMVQLLVDHFQIDINAKKINTFFFYKISILIINNIFRYIFFESYY